MQVSSDLNWKPKKAVSLDQNRGLKKGRFIRPLFFLLKRRLFIRCVRSA